MSDRPVIKLGFIMAWTWLAFMMVAAQDTQVVITGRNSQRLADGTIVYSEYFKIEYPGLFLLTADQAQYDQSQQIIEAVGNVKIDYQSSFGLVEVAARSVVYDLSREAGAFTHVSAQFGDAFYFFGEELEIVDRSHMVIKRGVLTSCDQPRPHWSVGVRSAEIEKDGYAVIKGAAFRFVELPILYLPYLILPAFQDRRTGLLIPETGSSARNGMYYGQPFYWAPRRDFDVTLTPWYYLDAGLQYNVEARYVPRTGLRGELQASLISDRLLSNAASRPLEEGEPISEHRYRVALDHVQRLWGGDLVLDVEQGSDFQYDRDFLRDTDQAKLRDYFEDGSYFRSFGRSALAVNWSRTHRILAGVDRIAEIAHQPSLEFNQPTQPIGLGFFLRSKLYLDWIDFEDLGEQAVTEDVLRLGADVAFSRTKNLTSWIHTRYGAGYLGAAYRARQSDAKEILGGPYAFAEILGPRLSRRYASGRRELVHFVDLGLDVWLGSEPSQAHIDGLFFDELDLRIADQVDGLLGAWKLQSRLFRGGQPFVDMEVRQRVNWESAQVSEPVDVRGRLFNPSGYHVNALLQYNPETNHIDTLSIYGNVNGKVWRGYGGYVRRTNGAPDQQDSLICMTRLQANHWPVHARVAFDYDFLKSRFKSREFQVGYMGSCLGLTLRYLETPFTSGDTSGHRWIQLNVAFKNLGEFGIKY